MIKLVWFVAFVHAAAGPQVARVAETTTFEDMARCTFFGEAMKERLADYMRGIAKLDWQDKIAVRFQCEPNGNPT